MYAADEREKSRDAGWTLRRKKTKTKARRLIALISASILELAPKGKLLRHKDLWLICGPLVHNGDGE